MSFNSIATTIIDQSQAHLSFRELASAPLGTLAGLSHTEGKQLMDALDVRTVAEFATSRYVMWAQAIVTMAKLDKTGQPATGLAGALDPSWQKKSVRQLAEASPSALAGVSDKEAKILAEVFGIRTIAELADNMHVRRAQVIMHLATIEAGQTVRQAA